MMIEYLDISFCHIMTYFGYLLPYKDKIYGSCEVSLSPIADNLHVTEIEVDAEKGV